MVFIAVTKDSRLRIRSSGVAKERYRAVDDESNITTTFEFGIENTTSKHSAAPVAKPLSAMTKGYIHNRDYQLVALDVLRRR